MFVAFATIWIVFAVVIGFAVAMRLCAQQARLVAARLLVGCGSSGERWSTALSDEEGAQEPKESAPKVPHLPPFALPGNNYAPA